VTDTDRPTSRDEFEIETTDCRSSSLTLTDTDRPTSRDEFEIETTHLTDIWPTSSSPKSFPSFQIRRLLFLVDQYFSLTAFILADSAVKVSRLHNSPCSCVVYSFQLS